MEEKGKNSMRILKLPMAGAGMLVLLFAIVIAVTLLTVTPVISTKSGSYG